MWLEVHYPQPKVISITCTYTSFGDQYMYMYLVQLHVHVHMQVLLFTLYDSVHPIIGWGYLSCYKCSLFLSIVVVLWSKYPFIITAYKEPLRQGHLYNEDT